MQKSGHLVSSIFAHGVSADDYLLFRGEENVLEHDESFSHGTVDKKGTFAARLKARALRVVRTVKMHCTLEEGVLPPERAAKGSLRPPTPRNSRQLRKRASTRLSRPGLWLDLRTSPHNQRLPSHPHENYKVLISGLGSGTASEGESDRSRRRRSAQNRNASSAKSSLSV